MTLFLEEETAFRELPTLRMLARPLEEIAAQAERIAGAVRERTDMVEIGATGGFSQMGSGSLPTQNLPTRLVAVTPKSGSADSLARRLRAGSPPVFTRVKDERVWIDPRTVLEGEEGMLVEAVVAALDDS